MSGRYELISVLGTGASSTVYLARHLKLKTFRAVKCISKTHSMPSSIFSEANLLERLNHPGIPTVYDLEEDESYLYIIEEYIQGESLEDILLKEESISQEYMMQIGIQICSILTFLHNQKPYPVIYQDLKPSHIIVCGNQIKIIDFGIASYFTDNGENHQLYGTKGFAAPECYRTNGQVIQSDLYALGAIFTLFLKQHNQKCSKAFRYIIRKSMKKNPKKRYASAALMQKALEKAVKTDELRESILLKDIAVVGANPGAGATQIAIAVNIFFNKRDTESLYCEHLSSQVMKSAALSSKSSMNQKGEIAFGYFHGADKAAGSPDKLWIHDYGCDVQGALLEDAEVLLLVVNLSVWQREAAWKAYKQLQCAQNLMIICNYNNRAAAKEFAKETGRSVYCYPFDTHPFRESREKRTLFTQMFEEKGER